MAVDTRLVVKPRDKITGCLVFTILSIAFGSSFLFGYNMGVINVPQTVVAQWIRKIRCERSGSIPATELGESTDIWCKLLDPTEEAEMFVQNSELNGLWAGITGIFCAGGLIGALSTGYFVAKFGRRGTLIWNNVIGLIAAALLGFPHLAGSYEMLMAGRFVVGLSTGVNSGVPAMYFSEIAPSHLRGAIGSLHQLFVVIAIAVSQILGLPYILGGSFGWQFLFAFAAVPCVFQLLTLPFCPESPKYLFLGKDDKRGARKALERLRGTTNVDEEMQEMEVERAKMMSEPEVTVRDLFTNSFLRRMTIVAGMLMFCQQLSGINAVMFYSTNIFKSAGLSSSAALYATIGMGIVNILMTLVSVVLVEKLGRKTLLLIGYSGMTVVTILLTSSMLVYEAGKPSVEVPSQVNPFGWAAYCSVFLVIAFVIMFATGPGSIPWFLVAELFTQGPRAPANSIAVGVNWMCSLIIAFLFPIVQAAIEEFTFIIFAVLQACFVAYTVFQVIETKGKTSDQIQAELRSRGKKSLELSRYEVVGKNNKA